MTLEKLAWEMIILYVGMWIATSIYLGAILSTVESIRDKINTK